MTQLIANDTDRKPTEALVKLITDEVLPALKAYYPNSDFTWRGNLLAIANEYAMQLYGLGVIAKHVRAALNVARLLSTTEKYAPNPIEFKLLCLQSRGMPTLDQCMHEINQQRIQKYGQDKEWSEPLVYWLNQKIAAARANMSDSAWQKLAKHQYTLLGELYGRGELDPIPLKIANNEPPAYLKYTGESQ